MNNKQALHRWIALVGLVLARNNFLIRTRDDAPTGLGETDDFWHSSMRSKIDILRGYPL